MPFIDPAEAALLREKMSKDKSQLGKLYKARLSKFHSRSVEHSLVEDLLEEGWEEYGKPLKTKTHLRKSKSHNVQFEDDIWCQLYRLGYRMLNVDENFCLPFGSNPSDKKQIDVVAIDDDSVLLVECKSSKTPARAPSYKTEFEALRFRLDGYRKAIDQIFGPGRRIKYIFATRNLRLSRDSADIVRLMESGGFYYNDNTFDYIESLLKSYRDAAHYQFMGLIMKGQNINKTKIEVPAIEGTMGGKTYYMFSLEPELLLKIGFVLHRTRANESEMPTYQRLLLPSRLKGITKFIDGGGFFPNSAILNFNERETKLDFQGQPRSKDSVSRTGILKIPNAFAIAYIIDGQHRIYGYANSKYKANNTIPVVAFKNLEPGDQLELFMQINENQKAVTPTLRITLEEDLYWNSNRLDSRLKALRSSVIRALSGDASGPLYGKISLGEDRSMLQAKPFADALIKCKLLPVAKGNKFIEGTATPSLYDTTNVDHNDEMMKARSRTVSFINASYVMAEESFAQDQEVLGTYILSNRGSFAFISLIGDLHAFEVKQNSISIKSTTEQRIDAIGKYLLVLFNALKSMIPEDAEILSGKLGSGAEVTWLRFFQAYINKNFADYDPPELQDWRERQDKALQTTGRDLGTQIERHMKSFIIKQLKALFGENWDIEIGTIQRECEMRAKEQMEKDYKDGLGRREIPWTDQFFIKDYKTIIEKYWSKKPEGTANALSFEQHFSIDIGHGFNSKADKIKWISFFNTLRNNWAHEGTKEKGLNKSDVELLTKIHDCLGLNPSQSRANLNGHIQTSENS
ncbi:DGQHR domain-containing protein [Acetobacter fabarum]|uniref:DGQHR domain-containing protein n=1 Tax=Acetobacter fabarum TaxID=483199 RepID=UPI001404AEA1|nr:DGQHR domain-containing protein [Acetobacter fabarum]NHO42502.1 DGQHR domain-containing protein [Acetobacter fabarum]GBQ38711.1 DGQHR domain-containing protein [Acetobacter fabarum DSM 19596]